MKKIQLLIATLLLFATFATTQTISKNAFKINLASLAFKNYSFQYERILNKKVSVAASFRFMPSSSIPFEGWALDATNDPDGKDAIRSLRVNNTAVTPEVRFYLGKKGFGKGFYIAPFYRYAHFEGKDMKLNYTNSLNTTSSLFLSGDVTAHTGGILFGTQWLFGKRVCLDIWWLGPHYGIGNGNFAGISSTPLTPIEQNEIRQDLENIDLPLTRETVNVNANGATVKLDGPWGGIRAGISLGILF